MGRLLLILASAMLATTAAAGEWRSTKGSRLSFEATIENDPLPGEFKAFDVTLDFDPDNLDAARLVVTVDLTAADLDDDEMNEILFDVGWFHTNKHKEAIFTSAEIVTSGDGYEARGTLDLKGRKSEVIVPFRWHPDGGRAVMTGRATIDRSQFRVGSGEWAGDDAVRHAVELAFKVALEAAD